MEKIIHSVIKYTAMFIELWGVLLILFAVFQELYKAIFKFNLNLNKIIKDQALNQGLAVALEFLLAAEILKTLIVRNYSQIIEVGALVIIRILIAVMLHWELKQKRESFELENKMIKNDKN